MQELNQRKVVHRPGEGRQQQNGGQPAQLGESSAGFSQAIPVYRAISKGSSLGPGKPHARVDCPARPFQQGAEVATT